MLNFGEGGRPVMTGWLPTPQIVHRLTIDTHPWLSCDDCFHLVDQYVELLLADPGAERPAMRVHLAGCSACAEEAESLLVLAAEDLGVDSDRWATREPHLPGRPDPIS